MPEADVPHPNFKSRPRLVEYPAENLCTIMKRAFEQYLKAVEAGDLWDQCELREWLIKQEKRVRLSIVEREKRGD